MMDYLILIGKCTLFYFVIIFALRIMGKREVGELSIFDIVIYFVMSELLALSIADPKQSIFKTLIPICTLAFLQILVSLLLLKSKKSRDIIDGKPVIIVENGILNQKMMKKERYNIDDFMAQMRSKDIGSPEEIAFAVLESSGNLSILPKNKSKVKFPFPLISDGDINKESIESIEKDECWLLKELNKQGINTVEEVFLCLYQKDHLYVIRKNH